MPLNIKKIKFNKEIPGFFRFKKIKDKFLLTNDLGRYLKLTENDFKNFLEGKIKKKTKTYSELKEKGFIKNDFPTENFTENYRQKNFFLYQGTSLHIIVATLRCNQNCHYCQTSSPSKRGKKYDMSEKTAKNVVDKIFQSPSHTISVELQGGEPLLNWQTVKFIINYLKKKNQKNEKKLSINLVSNLTLLDKNKYTFLYNNDVSFTTSLDGPENIHNQNRNCLGQNSYQGAVNSIKKIMADGKKISALTTISKNSLKYPKEIIDEYVKLGLREIHLRPLSYLGLSGKSKEKIGYPVEDFIIFWKKAIDYIISLNQKGIVIREMLASIMLRKILTSIDPNYSELRSPCGAGIGQIVYNFDGKVYTCDEGRMTGDDTFLIGNVKKNSFKELLNHPAVKSLCLASTLENLPCDNCVYKPYCGVCPVQNYALYGNIFPQQQNNERCKLHKNIFDYLFEKLENKGTREIFDKWVKNII